MRTIFVVRGKALAELIRVTQQSRNAILREFGELLVSADSDSDGSGQLEFIADDPEDEQEE